jgi:hypothetical protein
MAVKQKRWSHADLAAHVAGGAAAPGKAKQPKYRNRKVVVDGVTFDSAGEQARHAELCQLQRAGAITDLKMGVYFELAPSCHLGGKARKPALRYKADFSYMEGGALVVEDFKSAITLKNPVYRIKKHLMMTVHGIAIRESKNK